MNDLIRAIGVAFAYLLIIILLFAFEASNKTIETVVVISIPVLLGVMMIWRYLKKTKFI